MLECNYQGGVMENNELVGPMKEYSKTTPTISSTESASERTTGETYGITFKKEKQDTTGKSIILRPEWQPPLSTQYQAKYIDSDIGENAANFLKNSVPGTYIVYPSRKDPEGEQFNVSYVDNNYVIVTGKFDNKKKADSFANANNSCKIEYKIKPETVNKVNETGTKVLAAPTSSLWSQFKAFLGIGVAKPQLSDQEKRTNLLNEAIRKVTGFKNTEENRAKITGEKASNIRLAWESLVSDDTKGELVNTYTKELDDLKKNQAILPNILSKREEIQNKRKEIQKLEQEVAKKQNALTNMSTLKTTKKVENAKIKNLIRQMAKPESRKQYLQDNLTKSQQTLEKAQNELNELSKQLSTNSTAAEVDEEIKKTEKFLKEAKKDYKNAFEKSAGKLGKD